jgi:hypothetical protein
MTRCGQIASKSKVGVSVWGFSLLAGLFSSVISMAGFLYLAGSVHY